jgi:hypothetical protein
LWAPLGDSLPLVAECMDGEDADEPKINSASRNNSMFIHVNGT